MHKKLFPEFRPDCQTSRAQLELYFSSSSSPAKAVSFFSPTFHTTTLKSQSWTTSKDQPPKEVNTCFTCKTTVLSYSTVLLWCVLMVLLRQLRIGGKGCSKSPLKEELCWYCWAFTDISSGSKSRHALPWKADFTAVFILPFILIREQTLLVITPVGAPAWKCMGVH